MTPELAKKLKDAGFHFRADILAEYAPTLSELIEACGDDFMLTNECGVWEAWSQGENRLCRMGEAGAKFQCEGSTPEEAVANLWLALNPPDTSSP